MSPSFPRIPEQQMEQIKLYGLVPLVTLEDPADAVPLAKALRDGGVPVAEVTFRTAAGAESMRRIHAEVPEVLLGAGTVHTVAQAKEAVDCGASYIVTPAFNPKVIDWCLEHQIDVLPGSATPRDFEEGLEKGLKVLKFFPASVYGGVAALKAIAGPFADLSFLPTGGVDSKNMAEYLALKNVAAVGGSFICPSSYVKAKDWVGLEGHIRSLIAQMSQLELAHIGVNPHDEQQFQGALAQLVSCLQLPQNDHSISSFVGDGIELMKPGAGRGEHGHIGFVTPQLERVVYYAQRRGIAFDEDSARYDAKGRLTFVYFKDPVAGFDVHLIQK